MLVFRCECEHVLGVESESSIARAGECPACGRIIRVPDAPVNAKGKLKLAGAPVRATPSGAFRQIKDTKMDKIEAAAKIKASASNSAMGATPPPTFDASKLSEEPEILAPLTESEADIAGAETMITQPESEPEVPAVPEPAPEPVRKPPTKSPRTTPEAQPAKNFATAQSPVAGSSSKRRKMEAEAAAAAAADSTPKKSPVMLIAIVAAALLVIALALYFMGVFDKREIPNTNNTPPNAKADAEKKAETEKKAEADKKADAAKSPEPPPTPPAPNPDEKKKE